jgi:hypothetical protein
MIEPMKKGQGLTWDPASVELPEVPTIQPGQDALSTTIAAVLPTLGVPLAANVATLQAKEGMFAGKLGVAEAAYQTSDDTGSQSVGQVVGMLGQMGQHAGQMAQQAGAPMQAAGSQTGMFGSLMQSAMQAAQGAGGGAGGQSPGAQGSAGAAGVGAAAPGPAGAGGQPPPRDEAVDANAEPREDHSSREPERQHETREPLKRADDTPWQGASGPEHSRPGPAPVTPPDQPRHGADDDISRRL